MHVVEARDFEFLLLIRFDFLFLTGFVRFDVLGVVLLGLAIDLFHDG